MTQRHTGVEGDLVATVRRWTGREARALRLAGRMSVRRFAEHLGVNPAAVSNWERRGAEARLRYETQQILDVDLAQSADEVRERFDQALSVDQLPSTGRPPADARPGGSPAPVDDPQEPQLGGRSRSRTSALLQAVEPPLERLRYAPPVDVGTTFADFLTSPSRVFLVKGPPGTGKTRFVSHVAATVQAADFQLLSADTWIDSQVDLATEILRYASLAAGPDSLLRLERASAGLDRPLVVLVDGPKSLDRSHDLCRQLDVILRQTLTDRLRVGLVLRTPPEVDMSAYPVLAAAIWDDRTGTDPQRASLRLSRWDIPAARAAWNSSRACGEPDFDDLPAQVRELARLPLYMSLVKAAGAAGSSVQTNAYRLVDFCVRSIIKASGGDVTTVMARLGGLAREEVPYATPRSLASYQGRETTVAAVDEIPLPLLRTTDAGRPTFHHDAIREYFLATGIAQMIEAGGRPSTTVEVLNDLARLTTTSADLHGVFEFVLQCLDTTAPDLLVTAAQSPTISVATTLPVMLGLASEATALANADVIQTCAERCLHDSGLPLAKVLLRIPRLAAALGDEHPRWLLRVLRRFGSACWSDVVTHLEDHVPAPAVLALAQSADLETGEDAVFFARHFFSFFGDDVAVAEILKSLVNHPDWRVRAALADGLRQRPASHPAVDRTLDLLVCDQDYKVRAATAKAVGQMATTAATGHLTALLADSNWHVREQVLRGLALRGDPIDDDVRASLSGDEAWRRCPAHVSVALQRLLLLSGDTRDSGTATSRRRALFGLLREIRTEAIRPPAHVRQRLVQEGSRCADWLVQREIPTDEAASPIGADIRSSKERYRRLRDHRAVQIALDVSDIDHALVVAEAAAAAGIRFVEVGDPLIKSVGIDAITRVKLHVPRLTVVAEMMSADWGRDQVVLATEAGADVVLLIGPATTASVSAAVEASRRFAVPLVLDVPDGRLSQTWVQAMQRTGIDGFAITTNIDVGVAGSSPLDHAAALRRWTRLPIAVSGGFETTDEVARRSDAWDVLVVGRSVTDAVNPTDAARQVAAITARPSRRTQV